MCIFIKNLIVYLIFLLSVQNLQIHLQKKNLEKT